MNITKLLKITGVLFLLLAISLIGCLFLVNNSMQNERNAFQRQSEIKQLGHDLANASDFLTNEARRYTIFGDKRHFDNYWKEVKQTKTRDHVVTRLKELNAKEEELALIEKAKKNSDALIATEDAAMKAVAEGDLKKAQELMFNDTYDQNKKIIMDPIEEFQTKINSRTQSELAQSKSMMNKFLLLTSVLIFAMIILFFLTYLILFKKFKPLEQVKGQLIQLSTHEGDLTARLLVKSKDEIGEISNAFNEMISSLQFLIKEVLESTKQIAVSSESLIDEAHNIKNETNGINQRVENLEKDIQIQLESATESVNAMHELSKGIQTIAENMSNVAGSSNDTSKIANIGNEYIKQAIMQMKSINNIVRDSMKISKSLADRSDEIGKIVSMISDVAEQTNLLALNAAIEAARAGEHGKGFAVVAGEVRKLSEQTSKATNEISTLIRSIQEDATSSSQFMNKISIESAEGLTIITKTGESFEQILHSTQIVATQIQEISATSEQMSASTQEVTASIEEMSQISKRSYSSVEAVASQSDNQLLSIEQINNSANSQEELVQKLQKLLSKIEV